ncbi:hypothetical protein HPB49_000561 [Dermacentor silvarum]|uniref:Uncharacterized protein n=1 Tax=Dermacentor silvarum TaxID=543639 RepID=A0ACB8C0S1_DERSI|nr:hypothetical protein HPB49_000561 [Dermacentor silvarum]
MPRNRFEKLRNNLHIADVNCPDSTNRLWKVRPLLDVFQRKCKSLVADERLCINEQMVPFEGPLDMKQVRGGVEGLRVVDASVMPTIATANLNVPVHMIADRAATFIREDYEGASSSSGPSRGAISRILSWASRT